MSLLTQDTPLGMPKHLDLRMSESEESRKGRWRSLHSSLSG